MPLRTRSNHHWWVQAFVAHTVGTNRQLMLLSARQVRHELLHPLVDFEHHMLTPTRINGANSRFMV